MLHIAGFPSFLQLNNILLYVYTTFSFTSLSIDGHLDCFYILAIIHNGAVNQGVLISFLDSDFN